MSIPAVPHCDTLMQGVQRRMGFSGQLFVCIFEIIISCFVVSIT